MKTVTLTFSLLTSFLAVGSHASPVVADSQLRSFATCAGRLSAVMEHQWMFDGEASEQTQAQRAAVIHLISAIMEPEQGRQVLHWRLMAKHAQSVLLTRATFNDDPADAAWADAQAVRLTRDCTGLLLS